MTEKIRLCKTNSARSQQPSSATKILQCWEFKQCHRILCPLYLTQSSSACYYASDTRCHDNQTSVTSRMTTCQQCDYYHYREQSFLALRDKVLNHLKTLEEELHTRSILSLEEKTAIFKQRAYHLSRRISYQEPGEKVKMLSFTLGTEKFCIRIQYALEVIAVPEVTPIPCTPPYVAGIINVRGTILTLIDLSTFLEIEKKPVSTGSPVIVVEVDSKVAGLVVDKVENILDLDVKQFLPPLTTLKGFKEEFIGGEIIIEGHPYTLLNIEKVMNHEQMSVFEMVNPNL